MYICECGRDFKSKRSLSYHKRYCGNYKEFLDNGYKCKIGDDGKIVYIHRQVMEEKLGRKLKPGELVHHKDENKLNNDPDNLELSNSIKHGKHHYKGINSENWQHAIGENVGTSKLKKGSVIEIKKLIEEGKSNNSIADEYGVNCSTISDIRTGRTWKHI